MAPINARIDPYVFEVAVVPSFISGIICTCTLAALLNNESISTKHIRTNVIALTYGAIGCYALSMLIFSVGNIFLWREEAIIGFTIVSVFKIFYAISQVLIYWLLIFRVYHTFQGTTYALSKCTYTFFAMLVALFFLLSILAIGYGYLVVFNTSKIPYRKSGLLITCGREIIDFLITVYLVILFIKKLLLVTVDINNYKIDVMECGIVQFDDSQNVLLKVMTRFFVLTMFALISTQITIAMGTLSLIAQQTDELQLMVAAFAASWWLTPLDCCVNSICLYLMLEANRGQYECFCQRCQTRVTLCCQRIAQRAVKRSYHSIQNGTKEMDVRFLDESDI